MQELNPHPNSITNIQNEANSLTTRATETPTHMYEIISGEFVQDRQLNKKAIAVLKPNEEIQSSKYRPKKSHSLTYCPNGVDGTVP